MKDGRRGDDTGSHGPNGRTDSTDQSSFALQPSNVPFSPFVRFVRVKRWSPSRGDLLEGERSQRQSVWNLFSEGLRPRRERLQPFDLEVRSRAEQLDPVRRKDGEVDRVASPIR